MGAFNSYAAFIIRADSHLSDPRLGRVVWLARGAWVISVNFHFGIAKPSVKKRH